MIEIENEIIETSFFVNVFWNYKLNGFFIVIEVIDICFDGDGNSRTGYLRSTNSGLQITGKIWTNKKQYKKW